MNPAQFTEWELDNVEWLVANGTPRKLAERIMRYSKKVALDGARKAEDDRQFVINYRQLGPVELANLEGKSREALRKRYLKVRDECQQNLQQKLAS